jgi:hypothetical protein
MGRFLISSQIWLGQHRGNAGQRAHSRSPCSRRRTGGVHGTTDLVEPVLDEVPSPR